MDLEDYAEDWKTCTVGSWLRIVNYLSILVLVVASFSSSIRCLFSVSCSSATSSSCLDFIATTNAGKITFNRAPSSSGQVSQPLATREQSIEAINFRQTDYNTDQNFGRGLHEILKWQRKDN